ncbi:MAG: aldo/keto reductase [Melioribacteraceae bacterium]|nr:aldo/keto reductase [Melioribacteraceae bacterium]
MVPKIKIAPNGAELSRIIIGVWRLKQWEVDKAGLELIIRSGIELGITSFDHADIYGSYTCEETFGSVLKSVAGLRKQIELVTKCNIIFESPQRPGHKFHYYDTSARHIISSAEQSLRNFGTDYLDVLLIHRPDALMNADEVAEAFSRLKSGGKVLNFGVSNFLPSQFELLQSRLDYPLVTNQVEFSVMHLQPLEDGTFDQCQQLKISPMIWSPLAGGRLFSENTDQANRLKETINHLAWKYNATADQIALAWINILPSNPVSVIGTGKPERIQSAAESLKINLSREDWYRIWVASKGHGVP